jgi:heat shock protein HslJ
MHKSIAGILVLFAALLSASGALANGHGKAPGLPDSRWELSELEGQAAPPGAGGRQPNLEFLSEDNRVGGFAGCNRFMGAYTLNGPDLSFGPLGSTRMACPDGMALEHFYLGVLAKVSAYTTVDGELVLLDESGSALARYRRLTTP